MLMTSNAPKLNMPSITHPMVDLAECPPSPKPISELVQDACDRIPPLWPLKDYVAVNPFVGLTRQHFTDVCTLMQRVVHGSILLPMQHFKSRWIAGQIAPIDLQQSIEQAARQLPPTSAKWVTQFTVSSLVADLDSPSLGSQPIAIYTVADHVDSLHSTEWATVIVDEISKWCSTYFDTGQSTWRMPWCNETLFVAWKHAASIDANPEVLGLTGFRNLVSTLSNDVMTVIAEALDELQVPHSITTDFLQRQLMSIAGWSSYAQYQVREQMFANQAGNTLHQLLAIRLVYELALYRQFGDQTFAQQWTTRLHQQAQLDETPSPFLLANYVWQLAAEHAYQRGLLASLSKQVTISRANKTVDRPVIQAVFCIDVRSELLRRSLEGLLASIETIGFAGFFGFPIEYVPLGAQSGQAQCPVLLKPSYRLTEYLPNTSAQQVQSALDRLTLKCQVKQAWNAFKTSALSCFSFVETAGLLSALNLVRDAFGLYGNKSATQSTHALQGMPLQDQINVAAGALKNMGLTQNMARLVLLCGHASQSNNNPYAAGLDCGACGGHSGEVNARLAATVLNTPQVRVGLKEQGINIPDDTIFIAGLHNTTTDDVTLFEGDLPSMWQSHQEDLETLRHVLAVASQQARLQRGPRLGLTDTTPSGMETAIRARSRDWSQTRPEWGLAGNAAFIAAPRDRSKGIDLNGRVFLHNYNYQTDSDASKLTLIMSAPMIVASWINLQYYASAVNNAKFGSGNKVIHNVVGSMGIWQGNSGDLQVGLPLQSLHDGDQLVHEPLRLSVFIEAPRIMLESVMQTKTEVRTLFDNDWLHLIAIEQDGQRFFQYRGGLHWQEVQPTR